MSKYSHIIIETENDLNYKVILIDHRTLMTVKSSSESILNGEVPSHFILVDLCR